MTVKQRAEAAMKAIGATADRSRAYIDRRGQRIPPEVDLEYPNSMYDQEGRTGIVCSGWQDVIDCLKHVECDPVIGCECFLEMSS